jgi:hypothetical protein
MALAAAAVATIAADLFDGVSPCSYMRIKPMAQVRANLQHSLFSLDEGQSIFSLHATPAESRI